MATRTIDLGRVVGESAGFGTVSANAVNGGEAPASVSVEASGPDTAKDVSFTFTNMRGNRIGMAKGEPATAPDAIVGDVYVDSSTGIVYHLEAVGAADGVETNGIKE